MTRTEKAGVSRGTQSEGMWAAGGAVVWASSCNSEDTPGRAKCQNPLGEGGSDILSGSIPCFLLP